VAPAGIVVQAADAVAMDITVACMSVEAQWSLRREQWWLSRAHVEAAVRTAFATLTVAGVSATKQ